MDTMQWVWLFVALFVVLVVFALIANVRSRSQLPRSNAYGSGDDDSPRDGELGRDRDMDLERNRDADFDDDR
jgi:hypothetical protein